MRYTGPKAKLCRRLGVNLFGPEKYNRILSRKNYQPGMHGPNKRFKKSSEYALQLQEKQKARIVFGVSEKQFRNNFKKASKKEGETGENLLRLLELRLDNVIYVSQFAVTRMQARQMVSHGHFLLNGHRVTVPSIQVRPGDVITLGSRLKNSDLYRDLAELKDSSPHWLKIDLKKVTIEVLALPERDELEKSIDSQLIVEFYSR
jgi:small subunit ribosomal protein S4